MGFRDDNEALRAKVQALEEEAETLEERMRALRAENDELRSALSNAEKAIDESRDPVEAIVQDRERREREAERNRTEKQNRQAEKLAQRSDRVSMEKSGKDVILTIAPPPISCVLRDQVEASFFFSVMPGVFVMFGVGIYLENHGVAHRAALAVGVLVWLALLLLINIVSAKLRHPRWQVVLGPERFAASSRGSPASSDVLMISTSTSRASRATRRGGRASVMVEAASRSST